MAKYKHDPLLLMAVPELGTVKDLVTNTNFTLSGGVGTGFTDPSNYRYLLGTKAPVLAGATENLLSPNDTLTQNSTGGWATGAMVTLEASTDKPWELFSHSTKMTLNYDEAGTGVNVTAKTSASTQYTISGYFQGVAGKTYRFSAEDNGGGSADGAIVTATGDWQRAEVTVTFSAGGTNRSIAFKSVDGQAGDVCYISGVQLEAGAVAHVFVLDACTASSASIANAISPTSPMSFVLVIKPCWAGDDNIAHEIAREGGDSYIRWLLYKAANNRLILNVYESASDSSPKSKRSSTLSSTSFAADTIHIIIGGHDNAGNIFLYLDGVECTVTGGSSTGIPTDTSPLIRLDKGTGGAILAAMYNRVLTPAEIAEISAMTEWSELSSLEPITILPDVLKLGSEYSVKAEVGDTLRFVTMNHSLSGGMDYGVLLDLNDDGAYCASRIEYPPPAPEIEYRDPPHIDGREPSMMKYANREVTLTLNIFGKDKEDLANNVHELWQLLTNDNPILEWKPEGWAEGLYFDLIAPPLQFNVSDWFEASTHRWHKEVMSNVEIVIEAKPFARAPEQTVTLLEGNGSPAIPACTGIVVPPDAFRGDHPAPADIFIDKVGGELWTDLIFGQRDAYSVDFDPIQNMSVGDSQVTPAAGRLEDDYWVVGTGVNLVTNGGFENGSTGWNILYASSVEVTSDPAYVFEGTKALKMHGSHHYTDAAVITSAKIPIDPMKPYVVNLYYMGSPDADIQAYLLSGTSLATVVQRILFGTYAPPSQYTKLTKYLPVGFFDPADDGLWIRFFHDNWTANIHSSTYIDNVSVIEVGSGAFIQAEYDVASHVGHYLPTTAVSFSAAEDYDAVTINYIVADKTGTPITEQVQGATVSSGSPNTKFHDIAFMPSRFSAITVPSHRVSDFADKTEFLQQLRLETDPRATSNFWYDYVGLIPIDRGYIEVRNWGANEHLILDSRSSRMPLTSRSGTYDDAMVYDLEKTKGECSFVADPKGFNGAILAVTNKDDDAQILSYVNVRMVYSPLYLIVPEK